jgi:hypothetical protein
MKLLIIGPLGMATLKINLEQIEKGGFGGWLLQEALKVKRQKFCFFHR